jgi:para-aminobenzoate synthetase component 1
MTAADPFAALASVAAAQPVHLTGHAAPDGLDFISGWVGVLGYDMPAPWQVVSADPPPAGVALPRMWWMAVDQVLAFHHPTKQWWHCTARGAEDVWPWSDAACEARWRATLEQARALRPPRAPWHAGPRCQHTLRADYEAGVRLLRTAITNGELLQANLTRREAAQFDGDPWSLYEDLAAVNPAPFCAFLETSDFAIASCSPERFLRVREGQIQARPIKGTAARGRTEAQDEEQRAWLAASAKNRAENLMIVDLMRNDISRVAAAGSVRVPHLFAIEPHASVWQMVSTVEASLRHGASGIDLLRACWPPGSMTGAPKRAAMQFIERLEPVPRGFYSGALGYLDCRGNLDLAVVIRTAVVTGGEVMVQAGGGIVADSDPASEWEESVVKCERLLRVIGRGAGPVGAEALNQSADA